MDEVQTLPDEGLDWLEKLSSTGMVYLAIVVAWTAMLGSLWFSEVRGFTPCVLCWYQRILMYPLAAIIPIGVLRRDAGLPLYVIPLALIGGSISTYHVLLQKTSWFSSSTACSADVPCSLQYISWFNMGVTIPVLALTGFGLILLAMSSARRDAAETWGARGGTPWLPVVGAIGAVVAYFAVAVTLGW